VITFLIMLAIIALIAGWIARLLVPGRDPMSISGTLLLGVVGSFIGGFIGWAIFGKDLDEERFNLPASSGRSSVRSSPS